MHTNAALQVTVSCFEVYNETVIDLLLDDAARGAAGRSGARVRAKCGCAVHARRVGSGASGSCVLVTVACTLLTMLLAYDTHRSRVPAVISPAVHRRASG